jgi:hypothetical protein
MKHRAECSFQHDFGNDFVGLLQARVNAAQHSLAESEILSRQGKHLPTRCDGPEDVPCADSILSFRVDTGAPRLNVFIMRPSIMTFGGNIYRQPKQAIVSS